MHYKYDISICIVNYNSAELIKQAIDSIVKYSSDLTYEIILVNNSPEDDFFYTLGEEEKSLALIKIDNKANLGFSKANNIGFNASNGKYFLCYNPDLFLKENTLKICFDFLEKNQNYAACTVKFNYEHGGLQPSAFYKEKGPRFAYKRLRYASKLIKNKLGSSPPADKNIVDVDVACGAFLMVRNDVYKKINGYDEDFFLYGEDWEISNRIVQIAKIALLNSTTVIHMHGGASSKEFQDKNTDMDVTSRKGIQMYISVLLWQRKEFGKVSCLKLYLLILLSLLTSGAIDALKGRPAYKKYFKSIPVYTSNCFNILLGKHKVYKTM